MDIESNCACLEGYYSSENDQNCVKCPVLNCKKCDNSGTCLECRNDDLLPPLCSLSS